MRWRGLVEAWEEVEADSEDDAKKAMAKQLIERLTSGEVEFILWSTHEACDVDHRKEVK
jgi:uncharacterized protein YheU (UPF0270 family)